ncbi:MAG: hypothetical protein V1705_02630 [bacterium]
MTLKAKINLSLAVFVVLGSGISLFLTYPTFKAIRNNSSQIVSQKQAALLLSSRLADLEDLKKRNREIGPNFKKTSELFVQSELPVDFIRFLEKISGQAGLKIKISPEGLVSKDPLISGFQIALDGHFPEFLSFFDKMEASEYLIEVRGLNVSRVPFSENDIKVGLSIRVYSK